MSDFSVRFLTRSGCHLCDQARPVVGGAAARAGVTVDEVDIDGDDDLLTRFDLRIPVVLGPGGEVLAEGVIEDRRALTRVLRRAGGQRR